MVTLPPTHTLTQMPKNLTLVVASPKRLGALPVVGCKCVQLVTAGLVFSRTADRTLVGFYE